MDRARILGRETYDAGEIRKREGSTTNECVDRRKTPDAFLLLLCDTTTFLRLCSWHSVLLVVVVVYIFSCRVHVLFSLLLSHMQQRS